MSAHTLVVFLGTTRVGIVTRAHGPTAFSYDPAYLDSDRFIPVSLGLVSAYERRGGSTVRDVSELLRARLGQESNQRFVEGLIANYALGAPDGHARNYSILLMPKGQAILAPLYDVASALPYRVADQPAGRLVMREVAMSIGGERRFSYVRRSTPAADLAERFVPAIAHHCEVLEESLC